MNLVTYARRHLPLLLALLPGVCTLVFVLHYAVDVPFIDQWSLVTPISDFLDGTGTLAQLWDPHNQHRFFFGRLLIYGSALLTNWNVRAECVLIVLLAFGILFGIRSCLQLSANGSESWALPMLSLFVFSLHAYMSWLQGIQVTAYLSLFCMVWSLALLARDETGPVRIGFAISLGVVSSYSFSSGFLVWLVGLLLLISRRKALLWWLAAAVVTTAVHLLDLKLRGELGTSTNSITDPLSLFRYVCIFLGSPVVGQTTIGPALIAGFVGQVGLIILAVITWRRGQRPKSLVFLTFGLYSIGVAWMAALARGNIDVGQALSSRYTTHSAFLWISLVAGIFLSTSPRSTIFGSTLRALALIPCCLLLGTQITGWKLAVKHHDQLASVRSALLESKGLSRKVLIWINVEPKFLASLLGKMKARRLSLYRDCQPETLRPFHGAEPSTLHLDVKNLSQPDTPVLALHVTGGRPGNAAALYITRIGKETCEHLLFVGDLDKSGSMTYRVSIPDRFRQQPVGLTCMAIGPFVFQERSPEVIWKP